MEKYIGNIAMSQLWLEESVSESFPFKGHLTLDRCYGDGTWLDDEKETCNLTNVNNILICIGLGHHREITDGWGTGDWTTAARQAWDDWVWDSHYEGSYQGEWWGILYNKKNNKIGLLNAYYGSCGGCDGLEDAKVEEVEKYLIDIAKKSRVFKNIGKAIKYLETTESFEFQDCKSKMLDSLKRLKEQK